MIATQLVNKAVSGDLRFSRELLDRQQLTKGQFGEFPKGPSGKPVIPIEVWDQVIESLGLDDD